jgi:hypothetical protein
MRSAWIICACLISGVAWAQQAEAWKGKFEQLGTLLPTPNEYRTGSGSPGPRYWQQKADYVIEVTLYDATQQITGKETITYHNQSPETMKFLWLQLDQNILAKDNLTSASSTGAIEQNTNTMNIASTLGLHDLDGGFRIETVTDAYGKAMTYTINQTMMRVDLPEPLLPGKRVAFNLSWRFSIGDRMKYRERSGMEYFPADGNYVYTIAQFFPRMCVFDDYEGWQNKQFLGGGEFALPFGDYHVRITVPADHIVGATGWLQNQQEVLSSVQQERLERAKKTFDKPVFIVTQAEAVANEKSRARQTKTWEFKAENVRDFAFASSRKFIWDAMAVKVGDKTPLAMSLYPKEGNPLWEQESTKAIRNTLITYSKYTIDYPYPVAYSIHTADIGMEYPMICFNYGRPNPDGTYSDLTRYGMIGVIIHEVGHNFFPMIINSDERQWAWMDEGINSFIQYRTQVECYENFPHRRGPADKLVPYMKGDKSTQRPLMTNPEQVIQLGSEQYAKCATALNILRETVMGPELFDKSINEYAQRWAFKHPNPGDFFRTMEDASAVDLDWFWKGWFYTTDHVDLSVDDVKWYRVGEEAASLEGVDPKAKKGELVSGKNAGTNPFYGVPQPLTVLPTDERYYREFRNRIDDKATIAKLNGKNIYEVSLRNKGGLVMPVIIQWTYKDGTREVETIPAEVWRSNESEVKKVFLKEKEVDHVAIDPQQVTTDTDTDNNTFPRGNTNRFDSFKEKQTKTSN